MVFGYGNYEFGFPAFYIYDLPYLETAFFEPLARQGNDWKGYVIRAFTAKGLTANCHLSF
ncbi:hypothetical protein BAX97_11190 [Elizabethkingia meningoseptica]|nr:hypothetical protein [Elizabethkingia meningoseptica]OPC35445.1 hypothetical protein BAX97_11190 [Elizabethkingia meningoseptica]